MAPALRAANYIYEGIWTNWNKGPVLGSTWTVSPGNASIVSPAIAVFISIAGSQLWQLFQFALHQARATSSERDFFYHQGQVILRNTATDLNALWRLIRLAIAWRHQKDVKVLRSSLPLIMWTLLHFVLVVLAGLFSSWLLEANDEVLTRSPWCGVFDTNYYARVYNSNISDQVDVNYAMEYANYINGQFAEVQQHVDVCASSVEGCNTLPVGSLPWNSSILRDVCPFDSALCHPQIDGTMFFDTGLLSSSSDFGFNAAKKDHIGLRMLAQCAPLTNVDHLTGWQDIVATAELPAHRMADVLYGPGCTNQRNATFSVSQHVMECDERAVTPPYALNAVYAEPGGNVATGTATFDPIPGLQSTDKDTSLVMLSFHNSYDGPVSDPWFSAQQAVNDSNGFCRQQEKLVYERESPITTMGCTQQWQICNSDSADALGVSQCTSPLGLVQLITQFKDISNLPIALNVRQLAIFDHLMNTAFGASFYFMIDSLSQTTTPPLKARNLISNTIGTPLSNTQWQEETKYWVELLMTYMQQQSLYFSTGEFAASTDYINVSIPSNDPVENAAYWLCQNQIIHDQTYRNFNFFALLLTVAICTIIIILGLCIEDLIGYIRQRNLRYSGANCKQDMWIANTDVEMLRTIDELKNSTNWGRSKNGNPLAQPGYKVCISDLLGASHEVEKGVGVTVSAVKRRQTELNDIKQSRHPYGDHQKKCATCSTFEVSLMKNGSSTTTPSSPHNLQKDDTENDLTFHKDFRRDFAYGIPQQLLQTKAPGAIGPQRSNSINSASSPDPLPPQPKPHYISAEPLSPTQHARPIDNNKNSNSRTTEAELMSNINRSATARNHHIPYPVHQNSNGNDNTQDSNHMYDITSTPAYADEHNDVHRPPSGWGVLPKSWNVNGRWRTSDHHVR